jgi:glycosyltransferase involved in cell wall biosynthesis
MTTTHDAHDVRIFHKECRALAAAGHDVVLVSPHDRDETCDGVKIRAVPRPRGRLDRSVRTAYRVFRRAIAAGGDAYHVHDPELLPWGLTIALHGPRVIYDAHENLTKDVRTKHYLPGLLREPLAAAAGGVERFVASRLAGVVAATPSIAQRFDPERTVVVRNYPRLEEFPALDGPPHARRAPVALYLGGLSEIRGARTMVRAIGAVRGVDEIELRLAGRFDPPALEASLASEPGWARSASLGWRTRAQVAEELRRARVGLLLLHPAPNHLDSLPIKLFEYMAAGLPVVASDFPAWRPIVEGRGLLVDPLDPAAIARAIEWLMAHPEEAEAMGRAGRAAVERELHWDREAAALLRFYRRILSARGDGA